MGSAPGSHREGIPWCCRPLAGQLSPGLLLHHHPTPHHAFIQKLLLWPHRCRLTSAPPCQLPAFPWFQMEPVHSCRVWAVTSTPLPPVPCFPASCCPCGHTESFETARRCQKPGQRCVTTAPGQDAACRGWHGVPQAPLSSPAGLCTWLGAPRGAGRQSVHRGSSGRRGSPKPASLRASAPCPRPPGRGRRSSKVAPRAQRKPPRQKFSFISPAPGPGYKLAQLI